MSKKVLTELTKGLEKYHMILGDEKLKFLDTRTLKDYKALCSDALSTLDKGTLADADALSNLMYHLATIFRSYSDKSSSLNLEMVDFSYVDFLKESTNNKTPGSKTGKQTIQELATQNRFNLDAFFTTLSGAIARLDLIYQKIDSGYTKYFTEGEEKLEVLFSDSKLDKMISRLQDEDELDIERETNPISTDASSALASYASQDQSSSGSYQTVNTALRTMAYDIKTKKFIQNVFAPNSGIKNPLALKKNIDSLFDLTSQNTIKKSLTLFRGLPLHNFFLMASPTFRQRDYDFLLKSVGSFNPVPDDKQLAFIAYLGRIRGKKLVDNSFMSTSMSKAVALDFATRNTNNPLDGGVLLRISAPRGFRAYPVLSSSTFSEGELLLPPKTVLTITGLKCLFPADRKCLVTATCKITDTPEPTQKDLKKRPSLPSNR